MPKELREYQLSLVERVIRAYDAGARRICLVSPTGSGKTIVAAELIKQFVARGLRVMFQVHLDCLIGQTRSKLWDMGYQDQRQIGFIKAGLQENRSAPLQIASQQTLLLRDWWKERPFDVFFFDECHTTAFVRAADRTRNNFPDALYIGLTATPMRMKKTEGLADHFDLCIAAPVPRELMKLGYLAPMDYYSLPLDFIDLSRVGVRGGDFSTGELGVACNHPQSIDRCFEEYQKHGKNQAALIFAVTVDHAKALASRFDAGGVTTEVVTAKTPSEKRSQIYSAFKKGEIQALASVNCISTGFDVPNATVGIVARPTQSEGLWYQIVGRLMRPAPGKTKGIILDIAGNAWRFGIPDHIEKYELDFSQLDGTGGPPLKTCESCGLLNLIFAKVCRGCGAEFPVIEPKPLDRPLEIYHVGDLPQGNYETATDAYLDGLRYGREERYEEAIAAYQQAIQLDPKNARYHYELGNVYSKQERYEEAIAAYQQANQLSPEWGLPHERLGRIYRKQERYEEAIAAYQKAAQLSPEWGLPHYQLAEVYSKQERYEEAIAAYQKAIQLDPKDARYHYELGEVYSKQERYEEAIAAYQQAIQLDPYPYAYKYKDLGDLCLQQKLYEEAIAAYQQAIQLDPKNARYH